MMKIELDCQVDDKKLVMTPQDFKPSSVCLEINNESVCISLDELEAAVKMLKKVWRVNYGGGFE